MIQAQKLFWKDLHEASGGSMTSYPAPAAPKAQFECKRFSMVWHEGRLKSNCQLRGTQYHGHAIEKMKKHQAHNSEGHITYYRTPIASEKICQAWHQQQAEQRMHLRGCETSFIMVKVHMRIQGLCLTH